MTKITKEQIIKIAEMTRVSIKEHEFDEIIEQFSSVITYAERVVEIAKQVDMPSRKNVNVTRPDQTIPTDSHEILSQAPQTEDNYFVVPKFVDSESK